MRFSLKSEEGWLTWAILLVGGIYLVGYGFLGFRVGQEDWDHLAGYYELAWRFWRNGGGVPQYNPFLCGGRSLGGDPQLPIFHPAVLLVPFVGAAWTLHLEALFMLALGIGGTVLLARQLGADRVGTLFAVLAFMSSGQVIAKFFIGHPTLGFFFLMPLLLYLSLALESEKKSLALYAAYFALLIYAGMYKPNFVPLLVPLLFVEQILRAALMRKLKGLFLLTVGVALSVLVNAPTYLPSWRYFSDFPRFRWPVVFVPPQTLIGNLILPYKAVPRLFYLQDANYGPHEYAMFLGYATLPFAFWGWRRLKKENRVLALSLGGMALASMLLGFGGMESSWAAISPLHWLSKVVPGVSSLRVCSRYWFGLSMILILFSAVGFRKFQTGFGKTLFVFFGIVVMTVSASYNLLESLSRSPGSQWKEPAQYPSRILQVIGSPQNSFFPLRRGEGVISCMYNMEPSAAKEVEVGDPLSVKTSDFGNWDAHWILWDRITVKGIFRPTTRIKLNLNHSPYWSFHGEGAEIVSGPGERLTLKATANEFKGELGYRQPYAEEARKVGLICGLLFGLFAAFAVIRTYGLRPKARQRGV